MDPMRKGQRWILDAFIGQGGFDVLHPEAAAALEEFGYNSTDFKRVFSRVKSTSQMAAAWSSVAAELESRAHYWKSRGARTAAVGLFKENRFGLHDSVVRADPLLVLWRRSASHALSRQAH